MHARCCATLVVVLALVCTRLEAASRTVSFAAADGRGVTATLYEASRLPAAAVVLVPTIGHDRDELQSLAQQFNDLQISALAIELPSSLPGEPGALSGWSALIKASVSYLANQPFVRPGAIGLAGVSLGGSLAAAVAGGDPAVRALALISPSLDFRGVRISEAMRQYGGRPALLLASRRDSYAARSARELSERAPGPREVRLSETPAHGFGLLAAEPDLARQIAEWFQRWLA